MQADMTISIIIPAKNEAAGLLMILPALRKQFPSAELIVVDDGSIDKTPIIAADHGATVLSNPYSMGNGAAVKRGARHAQGDIFVFMDADGQHDPAMICHLLDRIEEGYDMAIGARRRKDQASIGRGVANHVYNKIASWITGFPIIDLTSGFRAVKGEHFKEFIHLLPNGFSYPTTITMAFLRSARSVVFEPVSVRARVGSRQSHIRPVRDGIRFFIIIFKIATLYSPLKIFAPTSAGFLLLGLLHYAYTFLSQNRFTNMGALLLSAAVIIFLIGLISEQITALTYKQDP